MTDELLQSLEERAFRLREQKLYDRFRHELDKLVTLELRMSRRSHEDTNAAIAAVNALKDLVDAPAEVRRTEGIRALADLQLALYRRYDPPVCQSEKSQPDAAVFPSLLIMDAHERVEVLLVGEAPAVMETKVGVAFVDACNLVHSRCARCKKFDECFEFALTGDPSKPRMVGCDYPEVLPHLETPGRPQISGTIHTAGDVLRVIMERAGLYRPSWGIKIPDYMVYAAATNASILPSFDYNHKHGRVNVHAPKQSGDWLWIEAMLIRPRATVLLGSVARNAYVRCAGGGSTSLKNPLDVSAVFGLVLTTYHPSAILRLLSRFRHPNDVLLSANSQIPKVEPNNSVRARLMGSHIYEVLLVAREVGKEGFDSRTLPQYYAGDIPFGFTSE